MARRPFNNRRKTTQKGRTSTRIDTNVTSPMPCPKWMEICHCIDLIRTAVQNQWSKTAVVTALIDVWIQAMEMLWGAAGSLVGIGSTFPSAMAFARRYIWLSVAPRCSMAAAITAQFRISFVMENRNQPFIYRETHPQAVMEIPAQLSTRTATANPYNGFSKMGTVAPATSIARKNLQ